MKLSSFCAALACLLCAAPCLGTAGQPASPAEPAGSHQTFPVPPPPFSEGIYPCSDCHEGQETDATRRKLTEEHANITLRHADFIWCLDCHDGADRDKLHLLSGEKIDFTVSYRLCAQCHGNFFRDWKSGIHGKRTGYWNGEKQYLLCAHCHNPHDPKFKPLRPLPPPNMPERWSTEKILGP